MSTEAFTRSLEPSHPGKKKSPRKNSTSTKADEKKKSKTAKEKKKKTDIRAELQRWLISQPTLKFSKGKILVRGRRIAVDSVVEGIARKLRDANLARIVLAVGIPKPLLDRAGFNPSLFRTLFKFV